jgi:hypothetical protein
MLSVIVGRDQRSLFDENAERNMNASCKMMVLILVDSPASRKDKSPVRAAAPQIRRIEC